MSANPTKENLQKAYNSHKKSAQTMHETISHKLLLFYALECGLKSYYLKQHNFKDAVQGKLKDNYGHDVKKLLKACKIPKLATATTKEGVYPLKDFHEYMRYGVKIDNEIESSQINYIKLIVEELAKLL